MLYTGGMFLERDADRYILSFGWKKYVLLAMPMRARVVEDEACHVLVIAFQQPSHMPAYVHTYIAARSGTLYTLYEARPADLNLAGCRWFRFGLGFGIESHSYSREILNPRQQPAIVFNSTRYSRP